jgi:hypothetical protein
VGKKKRNKEEFKQQQYNEEFADAEDLEAEARAKAANQRAKKRKNK